MTPILRTFQLIANDKVATACRQGARVVILQSPTGSGKSTMGADLVRRAAAKGKNVLFVVHRRRLVDQFSDRLRQFEVRHGVLMAGHRLERDCPVQVASRDTLISRCLRNEFMGLPPADLVIVDEGRHAAAPDCRAMLKHYEDRGAYVVLLDATPVLADGRGLGPWAQAIVCAARTSDLIRDKYLVPVKCYAPDRQVVRGKARRRGVAGDLVESWKEFAEGMPTVLFCSRVQHSLDAVRAFQEAGVQAAHVDADTKDDDRDRVFDGLSDGRVQVVANVGIIKEGVDIPCLGCCQFFMDPPGRVAFLQGCGRIMRPHVGKRHGVLIDHAGAVFRHGFPDEDTEWTLEGNADEAFKKKHEAGETEKVLYCKPCSLLYHGGPACPQCGRMPVKPPRSIFAPPPVDLSGELLTEAERGGAAVAYSRDEQVKHWMRCLATAANRNGSFGMAAAIYRRKYDRWPGDDFPCVPGYGGWKQAVRSKYPDFGRKKAAP